MGRLLVFFLICFSVCQHAWAQDVYLPDWKYDTSFTVQKRPVRAALGVVALNMSVWLFDRYVLQGDYAYISKRSIKNNFSTGFVWDTDNFSTNLLFHPLHGSYYFNIARVNGLDFWESTPFAWGGSLMWELFLENEPPSINDVFSTSSGGMVLGEVSFRLSSVILDDSKTGAERVARECLAAVVSPMRMFNRAARGELWRRRPVNSYQRERRPLTLQLSTGWRYLPDRDRPFSQNNGLFADLIIDYGSPFDNDTYRPFEYFNTRVMLNILGQHDLVASINALGILWGTSVQSTDRKEKTFGVFQHFDYYQTNAIEHSHNDPLKIAQTAAFGLGLLCKREELWPQTDLTYNVHANAILMGGTTTDHFNVGERNYDLGSGYGFKFLSKLENSRWGVFSFGVEQYHLFTWRGYQNEPNPIPAGSDIKHLNIQGTLGNTLFVILNPRLQARLAGNFSISMESFVYLRHSYYRNFPTVNYNAIETCLSLTYAM